LRTETDGKEALFLNLDLGSLKSVKGAAEEFLSKEKELHVLFNNGGVMMPATANQLTSDGYDLHFGTNVLGHFYFTTLLLPALLAGAKSSADGKARVVNLTSISHYLPSGIDFAGLKGTPSDKVPSKIQLLQLYAHSKFGNVVLSNQLAKRYGDQGIVSTAVNPGNLKTPLYRHFSVFERTVVNLGLYEPHFGALTQLWAGTSPQSAELNGQYLMPWARVGKPNSKASDEKMGEKLWEWMEQQVRSI
jgi:retinol dehydrogenase-12